MTALGEIHLESFSLPVIAVFAGALVAILLALCLKDQVKAGVRFLSFGFFLEAGNNPDRRSEPTQESENLTLPQGEPQPRNGPVAPAR